jgi:hypothetical protein
MKFKTLAELGLLTVSLALVGCGAQPAPSPAAPTTPVATTTPAAKPDEGGHAHGSGPNGGVVFDMGKYHAEFTVDHPKKECTVLFVTGDATDAKPLPVAATELTLTTKETKTADGTVVAPMTVKLLPTDAQDGKAAKFVGTDEGIGNVADFEGTVLGEIDGKPSQGTFKE